MRSTIACGPPAWNAISGRVWMPTRYGSLPMPMSYSSMLPEASMMAAGPSREPTQPLAVES